MVLKNIILDIIFPVVSLILIGQQIVDGKISSIQSLEGASIDGNFPDINEPLIEEDYHHINAASIDEGYPNINKASMEESYHNINAASIDQDYHDNLNSLSISLNDDQFEEKRPIDITKKLKDLGNRITSFFIGDNERSYEESSNYLTEAPVNSRADINKHINEEDFEENRVSSQQNLSELTKKLTVPDGNSVEMRVDYNKNVNNDAEIKTGNTKFENHVTHDKYISPQDSRMNTNEIIRGNKNVEDHNKYTSHEDLRENINEIELQDAINAMPLLKQYLKMFTKTEPRVNHRSNLNPQLRPQHDLPGLKRIQGFLKTTDSQLMNSSLPGFRGDPQLLNTFGKKLKGFAYSRK